METVSPLQTHPLTPFLLLRVFLTLEGIVPANFDPSLAPQGTWMLSPRQQTVTSFSTFACPHLRVDVGVCALEQA